MTVPAGAQDEEEAAKKQTIDNPDPAASQIYGTPALPKVVNDKAVQDWRAVVIEATGES